MVSAPVSRARQHKSPEWPATPPASVELDDNVARRDAPSSECETGVEPAGTCITIHPVILCGGSGQRLWPLSTDARPKQFLALLSDRTLIEETAARFVGFDRGAIEFAPATLVASARHGRLLRDLFPRARLVLEPCRRNSAAAVAAASLLARPDDLLLVAPSDHHIGKVGAFHQALATGARRAFGGELVAFGIVPTHPSTAYGYIEVDDPAGAVSGARKFVEKPELKLATKYLAGGRHLWNAGIFLFRAASMVAAFEEFAPDILASVRTALEDASVSGSGDGTVTLIGREGYAACRAQSIDFAVMEFVSNLTVVPVDMDWSDIGDHGALHRRLANGSAGTVVIGPAVTENVHSSFVRSDGLPVVVKDVSDLVIVASRDGVLVVPLGSAGEIKPAIDRATAAAASGRIAAATCVRAVTWLRALLRDWTSVAWDWQGRGFAEQLHLDGSPDFYAVRRTRVQARQVFTFARAATLALVDRNRAQVLARLGIELLLGPLRNADGGWVQTADRNQTALDRTRDLYDHAFIALAGAAAYTAWGDTDSRRLMDDAFAVIDRRFAEAVNGGYIENLDHPAQVRRSNPHMHLLEASLDAFEATGEESHLDRARAIVELFETAFFDSRSSAVLERFNPEWRPFDPGGSNRVEPGHCYEWATLLMRFETLDGRDLQSWRRRLIGFADRFGVDAASGFARNAVTSSGGIIDSDRRLWPQLEMLRARMGHPETAAPGAAESLLERILSTYLADGPGNGWIDEYFADGSPKSIAVPASMLYHFVTAFGPLASAVPDGTAASPAP